MTRKTAVEEVKAAKQELYSAGLWKVVSYKLALRHAKRLDSLERKLVLALNDADIMKANDCGLQIVEDGWRLLKDTTHEERSWPEDYSHENGHYSNTCCECGRAFTGHKRRVVCKACVALAAAQEGEGR